MKKILFYTSGVGLGGVERVILELMEGIKAIKFNIKLGLQYGNENLFEEEIPQEVKYKYMLPNSFIKKILLIRQKKSNVLYRVYYSLLLKKERSMIKKNFVDFSKDCDIAIDFKSGDFIKHIKKFKGKKICWFHTSLTKSSAYRKGRKKLLYNLKKMDKIVVVCDSMKEEFEEEYPELRGKLMRIYNPFNIKKIEKMGLQINEQTLSEKNLLNENYIVAVTRFEKITKDVETLIRAYRSISNEITEKLYIIGDGPDRKDIENLIEEMNLKERVILLGIKKNPYIWIKNAEMFVHSSKFEGFGMVLVEAMICGTPVISTDCPVGPREILQEGKNGRLVPVGDSKEMGKAILKVLTNTNLKKNYIVNAKKRVKDFSIEKTVKDVEKLFDELDGE
jgi:hypothetical protein